MPRYDVGLRRRGPCHPALLSYKREYSCLYKLWKKS